MAKGVVRTDKMAGTDVRSHLVSIKYGSFSGTTFTAAGIDNGNVVVLGDLLAGEREVYAGTIPARNSALGKIVLIASPEVLYESEKKNLDEFTNEAGKIARGYRLHSKDIFSVTSDALEAAATIAVGDVVELKAGTKLQVVAAATGLTNGSTHVGNVIAIEVADGHTYYVIQVV